MTVPVHRPSLSLSYGIPCAELNVSVIIFGGRFCGFPDNSHERTRTGMTQRLSDRIKNATRSGWLLGTISRCRFVQVVRIVTRTIIRDKSFNNYYSGLIETGEKKKKKKNTATITPIQIPPRRNRDR